MERVTGKLWGIPDKDLSDADLEQAGGHLTLYTLHYHRSGSLVLS